MFSKKSTARMAVFCGLMGVMATAPLVGCGANNNSNATQQTTTATTTDNGGSASQTATKTMSAKELFAEMNKAEKSENFHMNGKFDVTADLSGLGSMTSTDGAAGSTTSTDGSAAATSTGASDGSTSTTDANAVPSTLSFGMNIDADVMGDKSHSNVTISMFGADFGVEQYAEMTSDKSIDIYELSSASAMLSGDTSSTPSWTHRVSETDKPWSETLAGIAEVNVPDSAVVTETSDGWQITIEGKDVQSFMERMNESMGSDSAGMTGASMDAYENWHMTMDVDKQYRMTGMDISADVTSDAMLGSMGTSTTSKDSTSTDATSKDSASKSDKPAGKFSFSIKVDGFDTVKEDMVTVPADVKSSATESSAVDVSMNGSAVTSTGSAAGATSGVSEVSTPVATDGASASSAATANNAG